MAQYRIPIDRESERFLAHISINGNKRIIFSGPFGSGKTTFLYDFFNKNKQYTPIFLRPINYSIASNKDIFEYIKVDVLFDILKIATADNVQYSNKELMPAFIADEIYPFICRFIKAIPYIGKPLEEISKALKVSIKRYEEFKESKNETEYSILNEFLTSQLNEEGNIFEENNITCAIRNIIEKYKGESKKQMVLIIDDLDRIDPEHIFRILNVFACNADSSLYDKELDNKFGFDKIMVVCDINNLRCLFAHKYGGSTDFCGYIDKFYNTNIYGFSLKKDIITYLFQLIKNFNTNSYLSNSYEQVLVLRQVLTDLISKDLVSLRSLHNLNALNLYKGRNFQYGEISMSSTETVFVLYQYVKAIYITQDKINDIFSVLKSNACNKNFLDKEICYVAGYFCYFIFKLQGNEIDDSGHFTIEIGNNIYGCKISESGKRGLPILVSVKDLIKEKENVTSFNLYYIVEEALLICKQIIESSQL